MKWNQITIEKVLFVLVMILAVVVRFYNLGAEPLSDGEASRALQALSLARGQPVTIGPDTGYATLTGLAFLLSASSDFMARLLPALAGSLLVMGVYLFRSRLGSLATLILMTGLALDPGMVTMSRLAGSPIIGLGFGVLALGLAYLGQPVWAGISAGLALLGGPTIIQGALGLALGWGTATLLSRAGLLPVPEGPAQPDELDRQDENPEPEEPAVQMAPGEPEGSWLTRKQLITVLISAALTVLLVGTLFLRFPQGLSGWAAGLPTYLMGWIKLSGVPALRVAGALVIYQPLALIFGLMGAVRGWLRGSRLAQTLTLWFFFSFVFALLYPGRQVGDLVWTLFPLWVLAAIELAEDLSAARGRVIVPGGLAILVFLLMALFWLSLAGMNLTQAALQGLNLRLGVLAGLIGLGLIATVLVGFGWSWDVARKGLAWGVCTGLSVYVVSMMWSSAHIIFPDRLELWKPAPTTQNEDLFLSTLKDLSTWNTGMQQSIDVTLTDSSASLRWALRDYSDLTVLPDGLLPRAGSSPSIVVTRKTTQTTTPGINQLAQAYRGQDFAWWTFPAWQGAMPPNFLRWLTTHEAPLTQEQVILWARSDLFPSGGSQPKPAIPGQSPGAGEGP